MTTFLLEILSEEIPAKMQKVAAENFTKIASEVFSKNNLVFENSQIKTFVTPRRLVLELNNLKLAQEILATKKIGPKITADKKAIAGFLKSVGLKDESELETVENNGATCYLFTSKCLEIKTSEIIKNSLPQILQKMTTSLPKLMRWDVDGSAEQPKWIRPIRNILCLFGSEVIDVEFVGLKSNNLTFGHYAYNDHKALKIEDSKDYKKILQDNFVILNQSERKQKIIQQILSITFKNDLETIDEEGSSLFDEVTGLCEFPTAMLGKISENSCICQMKF